RDHARRLLVARETEVCGCGEGRAGDRTGGGSFTADSLCRGEAGQGSFGRGTLATAPGQVATRVGETAREAADLEGATVAQASHGRGGELHARPMGGAERLLQRWRGAHRQQCE